MSTPFNSADKVNAVIRIRRGPESDRTNNTYESGELIYTIDKKRVYVGDAGDISPTNGGNLVGNKAWVTNNFTTLSSIEIGDSVYRTDTSSYYVLTGSAYTLESSYALVGGNQLISQNISNGTIPKATKTSLGVIQVGANLDINNGILNLSAATNTTLGGVKVGTGLSAATDGTLSIAGGGGGGGGYTLSAATNSTLGGVIVGKGLSAATDGRLSLSAIPETANLGQILTWNNTKWIATDPSTIGIGGDAVPVGTVMYFAASANIPLGYLECDGTAISRAKYKDLDAAIYCGDSNNNTALFGYRCTVAGPPAQRSTTGPYIVLPDLRGEFVRGWSHGKSGVDAGRAFGGYQPDEFKSHNHEFSKDGDAPGGNSLNSYYVAAFGGQNRLGGYTSSTGGPETRPRNVALVACIKALKTGAPAVINYIPRPATATDGDVLTYQYSSNSWIAKSSNAVLNDKGYTRLPNGSIIQWGSEHFGDVGQNGNYTIDVVFEMSFPNDCYVVTPSIIATTGVQNDIAAVYVGVISKTKTGAKIYVGETTAIVQNVTISYIAIGS